MRYKFNTTKEKFEEGQKLIEQNGGTIGMGGVFKVKGVEGGLYFNSDEGILNITIDSKPWLASWGTIESKLNEFFK